MIFKLIFFKIFLGICILTLKQILFVYVIIQIDYFYTVKTIIKFLVEKINFDNKI